MATKAGESPEDLAGSCHLPLQPSSRLSWMEHRNELREGGRLPKKGRETEQHPKRKPLNFRAWSCCVGAGAAQCVGVAGFWISFLSITEFLPGCPGELPSLTVLLEGPDLLAPLWIAKVSVSSL